MRSNLGQTSVIRKFNFIIQEQCSSVLDPYTQRSLLRGMIEVRTVLLGTVSADCLY